MVKDKMAAMPPGKLLINMAAPMMISMFVQALYNVVDTFFVSYIPDTPDIVNAGDKAINALTLAFPIQMLMLALIVGTGVGICAVVSRRLGMGDKEGAEKGAGNALFIAFLYYAVILLFGLFGVKAFINSQTANNEIAQMAVSYLSVVTVFSLGYFCHVALEKIVQAAGRTTITMVCQMSGALTNIILDPVFIFIFSMGVRGAAIATVIGQTVSFLLIIVFMKVRGIGVDVKIRNIVPDIKCLKEIYKIGLPSICLQLLTSVMSYAMNLILGLISVSAVTAFGVYSKLQNFIFMPCYGLNNASIPIISYNYGAKNRKRVKETLIFGLSYVTAIMALGIVLLQVFATNIVSVFSVTEETFALSVTAIRTITLGFLFAGADIILQGECSALGKGTYSLLASATRAIFVTLPLAYIFSRMANGEKLVWLSVPIAECAGMLVIAILAAYRYKTCWKEIE